MKLIWNRSHVLFRLRSLFWRIASCRFHVCKRLHCWPRGRGSRECAGAAREGKNTRDEDTRGQIKNKVIHALATLKKRLVSGTTFCFAGTE